MPTARDRMPERGSAQGYHAPETQSTPFQSQFNFAVAL